MPESEVVELIRSFRADLLNRDEAQMSEMTRRWVNVERRLEAMMYALAVDVSEQVDRGEGVSIYKLAQMERYQALLAQVDFEIGNYNRWLTSNITDTQQSYARFGIESSTEAINAIYQSNNVRASFDVLPVDAVQNMVGITRDGTPLGDYLQRLFPTTTQGITESLIKSTALGRNPKVTAREMARGSEIGLEQALTISRTEQLRVFREASRRNMQESGVVSAYKRIATRDTRVCAACLLDDGRVYRLSQEFAEHVKGRCGLVPVVKDMPEITWQYGRDWFLEQSPADQIAILGQGRWDAWKAGSFKLADVVKLKRNETWGPSIHPKSLQELAQ